MTLTTIQGSYWEKSSFKHIMTYSRDKPFWPETLHLFVVASSIRQTWQEGKVIQRGGTFRYCLAGQSLSVGCCSFSLAARHRHTGNTKGRPSTGRPQITMTGEDRLTAYHPRANHFTQPLVSSTTSSASLAVPGMTINSPLLSANLPPPPPPSPLPLHPPHVTKSQN